MPVATDIFAKLNNGGKFFSKLDLKSAHHLCHFQEMLETQLQDCLKYVNFRDVVLVAGATTEEHHNNRSRALEKLWDAKY